MVMSAGLSAKGTERKINNILMSKEKIKGLLVSVLDMHVHRWFSDTCYYQLLVFF
jgi:hypothetical protein